MATQDSLVIETFCGFRGNDFAIALRGHNWYTYVLGTVAAQNSRCQSEFVFCFYANMSLQG